jgi:hypothetical protein
MQIRDWRCPQMAPSWQWVATMTRRRWRHMGVDEAAGGEWRQQGSNLIRTGGVGPEQGTQLP